MSEVSSIRRSRSKDNYTRIDNDPIRDDKISWKAKGLLIYLLHLPDDWIVRISDLQNRAKDGRDATRSGITELIKAGYIVRQKKLNQGKFNGYEYTVYDRPEYATNGKTEYGETVDGKSVSGLSVDGKSVDGKPDATNNPCTKDPVILKTNDTNETGLIFPQTEFAAHADHIFDPEETFTPVEEKKKKPPKNSAKSPPSIPAWTAKVKDLFDRVNEEESLSAGIPYIAYSTAASPGRDFAAFKVLRGCIESHIGKDPEESKLMEGFEYLFRYGFRYLNGIAQAKGGALQYNPLTIQHTYNQIRQYAQSIHRPKPNPVADLAASFVAEYRAEAMR